ncbi:phosphoheptose isomerase [Marinomonas agarivorans]|nr:phosphoheptose isomerase [Marinomonas agarivorans]
MTDDYIKRCHHFIFNKLLTKWADFGINKEFGYSVESLTTKWQVNPTGRIRLLTQCRQLYTFSHAYLLTKDPKWLAVLKPLYSFIVENYVISLTEHDIAGSKSNTKIRWRFSLDDNLAPLDDSSDAYALAFVLLSFSFYYQVTQDESAISYIEQTDSFLNTYMSSEQGGFYETYPVDKSMLRRQNPHMHLLEGYIAAYQVLKKSKYKDRIIALLELLKTHFFDATSQSLIEFFNNNWQPDQKEGHKIEPGHHFEWVWLLHQAYKIHDDESYLSIASHLWEKACEEGFDPKGGIYNQIHAHLNGVIDREKRIWPITEYIKAICVQCDHETSLKRLKGALDFMFEHYLLDDGSWNEYLDGGNQAKDYPLPGTTSYHIFLGFAELLNWHNNQHN